MFKNYLFQINRIKTVNVHVLHLIQIIFVLLTIPSFRPLSTKKFSRMSDSSDDNLSELEEEQIPDGGGSDDEGDDKPELKGILDDVEETNVSWKDLVSLSAGA